MALPIERFAPAAYDLYEKMPVSDVVEHGFLETFYPKNELSANVIEFIVEGNSEQMIIPSCTYLKLKLELVGKSKTADDTPRTKTVEDGSASLSVINAIFYSYFEQVEIFLSNECITKSDRHYPYISLLQTICSYGKEPLETYFEVIGWKDDTAGSMDIQGNEGFAQRRKFFSKNNTEGEFFGKICSPLFHQEKALPTQISMRIKLIKARKEFFLLYDEQTEKEASFDVRLKEAVLLVQKVSVVSGLRNSYIKLLEEDHPIPYFLTVPSVMELLLQQGSSQYIKDNMFLGRLPRRIVIGMVETEACYGDTQRNPFNFQDFALNEICLYKDGMPYPRPLIRLNFESNEVVEAYHYFMSSLQGSYSSIVPAITKDQYMRGKTLFSYDMSPDQLGSTSTGSLLNINSNVRLEMKFKRPLLKNITILVYYELDHLMEIYRDRRVAIDIS